MSSMRTYLPSVFGVVKVAQRSLLVDVDKGTISREELFARGEVLFEERLEGDLGH